MKIVFTFLGVLFFLQTLLPQSNNVKDLYSDDIMTAWTAVKIIRNNNETDAIPALLDLLDKKPPFLQLVILKALKELDYQNVEEKTLQLINRADSFAKHTIHIDPLEAKIDATAILFDIGNFSTANLVFDILNRDKPKIYSTCIKLLPKIIRNVPEKKDKAKEELIYILENNKEPYYRYHAMIYLYEELGAEMHPFIKKLHDNDDDPDIKKKAAEFLVEIEGS
jgi:hypothetical protein